MTSWVSYNTRGFNSSEEPEFSNPSSHTNGQESGDVHCTSMLPERVAYTRLTNAIEYCQLGTHDTTYPLQLSHVFACGTADDTDSDTVSLMSHLSKECQEPIPEKHMESNMLRVICFDM
jgi:hypothetical protein